MNAKSILATGIYCMVIICNILMLLIYEAVYDIII